MNLIAINLNIILKRVKYINKLHKQTLRVGKRILLKFFKWLPDIIFLRLRYYFETGQKLHLKNPRTFNEKLQWLKINDRKPEYTQLVDKAAVKSYIAPIIGEEYVIPTIGLWNTFDEIDFEKLPSQFVLKTTHGGGGGGVIICRNNKCFDKVNARLLLEASLNSDIYTLWREWPYKNVNRKILAEPLIPTKDGDLRDYKFFCFNGEPKFLKVDFGRFIEHHANYYDLQWNLLPFGEAVFPPVESHQEKRPENFDKMVEIAKELSAGHKFLRVDLYNVEGKIYFGELTFYPASGMGRFTSEEWERKVGDMLNLEK